MSINNMQVFQTYFSPLVKEAYQKSSILGDCVRSDGKIVGDKAQFRKSNSILAVKFNKGADLDYAGTRFEPVEAQLEDFVSADLLFDTDKYKFNFDEAKVLSNNVASAIGRRVDQVIINNALNKTTTTPLGSVTSVLNVNMLLKASEFLNDNAVDKGERYIVHTSAQLTQLLSDDKLTSSEYAIVKALVSGEVDSFMGFKFINMEKRLEGGLPAYDSTGVKAFAFHKQAVGKAIGEDMQTSMERIAQKKAWQIACSISIGAVNIDDKGIIPLITKASNE